MENIFGLEMGTAILKSEKAVQAIVSEWEEKDSVSDTLHHLISIFT